MKFVWLKWLLSDIVGPVGLDETPEIQTDNKAASRLAQNPKYEPSIYILGISLSERKLLKERSQ